MILDENQYEAAKKNCDKLNKSIVRVDVKNECADDPVKRFELASLKKFANQIWQDIEEFEMLRGCGFQPPESYHLTELPKILIQARIARGWTQKCWQIKLGQNCKSFNFMRQSYILEQVFLKKCSWQIAWELIPLVVMYQCLTTHLGSLPTRGNRTRWDKIGQNFQ